MLKSSVIPLVIGLNGVIALLGFYATWRLWEAKGVLAALATTLVHWERRTHQALAQDGTLECLRRSRAATVTLREQQARLQQQLRQLKQIIAILAMLLQLLPQKPKWYLWLLRMR